MLSVLPKEAVIRWAEEVAANRGVTLPMIDTLLREVGSLVEARTKRRKSRTKTTPGHLSPGQNHTEASSSTIINPSPASPMQANQPETATTMTANPDIVAALGEQREVSFTSNPGKSPNNPFLLSDSEADDDLDVLTPGPPTNPNPTPDPAPNHSSAPLAMDPSPPVNPGPAPPANTAPEPILSIFPESDPTNRKQPVKEDSVSPPHPVHKGGKYLQIKRSYQGWNDIVEEEVWCWRCCGKTVGEYDSTCTRRW
ncbi:hypothetical protein QBC43DRAFT_361037 [Cladorrhinum sp. PSN259]|nr:hypothetical protein QBC43DRAFT_361037 [Cladorrhinum sp. PSN259]